MEHCIVSIYHVHLVFSVNQHHISVTEHTGETVDLSFVLSCTPTSNLFHHHIPVSECTGETVDLSCAPDLFHHHMPVSEHAGGIFV